jgi:DNA mismatch repair ATPase MutL
MKLFIGTTLLLLLAGAPAFAGQEPDKDKPKEEPKKQEEPKKAPKPAEKPKQEPARQQQDNKDRAKQDEERKSPPPKPAQTENRAQDQQRAKQTEQHSDNNAQHANGRRIPEEKFRASFGSEHHFHVQRGSNRFNYGGFWFNYSQPWPGDWDYNDDVYIEDVDGEYYLINPRHPGVRLIVVVGD